MAQDNPFLSFFESMGTGMEAGAERRSLMQRAERGQLEPGEEVPGLGRTILKGITRAATPANTRLAQDQMKLQIANQVLDEQIFEAKQQAAEAEKIALKTKASKEARAERDNSILFADLLSRTTTDLSAGKFDTLSGIKKEAEGLPVTQQVQLNSAIGDLSRTYDLQKVREFSSNQEILSQYMAPEDVQKLGPMQAQTLVEILSGRYQSGIGQMVGDLNNLNTLGLTNLSALVMPAIEKQAKSVGRVVEFSPTTGTYTMREELIGGSKPEISKTEEAERTEGLESVEILFSTLDQTRSLVERNPNLVGSTGEISGGLNAFKEIIRPFVALPQDANRLQVEKAFATLKTQALTSLGGGSLARLTDKDAKILEANIPQLTLTDSPTKVMQVLDQLEGTISLRYLLNRSRTNTLGNMLDELGASRVGKLSATAGRLNFRPGLVDEVIRESINSIDSQTDQDLARQQILDLFTALRDYGFSDAEREPYIQYAETLSAIE